LNTREVALPACKGPRRTLWIKVKLNGSMKERDLVLSFLKAAVRIYLSITQTLPRRDSDLYMTARKWNSRLPRGKKDLRRSTYIPAQLKAAKTTDFKKHRPYRLVGPFVFNY